MQVPWLQQNHKLSEGRNQSSPPPPSPGLFQAETSAPPAAPLTLAVTMLGRVTLARFSKQSLLIKYTWIPWTSALRIYNLTAVHKLKKLAAIQQSLHQTRSACKL